MEGHNGQGKKKSISFSGHLGKKRIFLRNMKRLFENWGGIVRLDCEKCKINYFLGVSFPLRC